MGIYLILDGKLTLMIVQQNKQMFFMKSGDKAALNLHSLTLGGVSSPGGDRVWGFYTLPTNVVGGTESIGGFPPRDIGINHCDKVWRASLNAPLK